MLANITTDFALHFQTISRYPEMIDLSESIEVLWRVLAVYPHVGQKEFELLEDVKLCRIGLVLLQS